MCEDNRSRRRRRSGDPFKSHRAHLSRPVAVIFTESVAGVRTAPRARVSYLTALDQLEPAVVQQVIVPLYRELVNRNTVSFRFRNAAFPLNRVQTLALSVGRGRVLFSEQPKPMRPASDTSGKSERKYAERSRASACLRFGLVTFGRLPAAGRGAHCCCT